MDFGPGRCRWFRGDNPEGMRSPVSALVWRMGFWRTVREVATVAFVLVSKTWDLIGL